MSENNPLLTNASVQGAAKSIEGLLNPKGIIESPKKEAKPVEPKESKAKAEENLEEQQQPEVQPEEQETLVEEEASEENANEEQTTDLHQIKVNGEIIEVDLEELKAGYQKDADYRRKTEELSLERKELAFEKERLAKAISTKMDDLNSLVLTLNAEVNSDINAKELDKLWDEDPTEAARIDRKIRRRRENLSQAQKKLKEVQEQQFQEILKEEQKKVTMKFPELQDPVKGNSLRSNMTNYLLAKGFSEKDVNSVYDSRMFEVIVDGMKYQENKKLKPTLVNNKVKPSKVIKSGVKSTKEDLDRSSRLEKIRALKKSGSPKDATDLLMRYL
jgi:hypothetical protein